MIRIVSSGLLVLLMLGCRGVVGRGVTFTGDDEDPPPPPGSGIIEVSVTTTNGPATLSYTVSISNGQKKTLPANGVVEFTTSRTGHHDVAISGVPPACTLSGPNPVAVEVANNLRSAVGFAVLCQGPSP